MVGCRERHTSQCATNGADRSSRADRQRLLSSAREPSLVQRYDEVLFSSFNEPVESRHFYAASRCRKSFDAAGLYIGRTSHCPRHYCDPRKPAPPRHCPRKILCSPRQLLEQPSPDGCCGQS